MHIPFDNEHVESNILRADVEICVQGRQDQPIHAHKLILVSDPQSRT